MSTFATVMWSIIVVFFMVVYFMILFGIIGDLFRSRDMGGWAKAIWVVALLVFPLVTALIYLIVRGSGMSERAMQAQSQDRERVVAVAKQIAASEGGPVTPADQISQAKVLLDSGAITQQEFETLKAKALA